MSQRAIRNAGSYTEWAGLMSLFGRNDFTRGLVLKHQPAPAIHTMDSDGVATLVTNAQSMEALRTENTVALITQIDSRFESEKEATIAFYAKPKNEGSQYYNYNSNINAPAMNQLEGWQAMVNSPYFHNNYVWGSTTYHANSANQVRVYDNLLIMKRNERGYMLPANQIPQTIKRTVKIPPMNATRFEIAIKGFKVKAQALMDIRSVANTGNMVRNNLNQMTSLLGSIEQETELLAKATSEIDEYDAGLEAFDAWMKGMPADDAVVFTGNYNAFHKIASVKRELGYMRNGMPTSEARIQSMTQRIESSTTNLLLRAKNTETQIALATNHCDGVVMCNICAGSIKIIASLTHLDATIKQAKGDEQ
tara:strand:+ start:387 stop:1478 length:1092 start_codon:yes stop_codon:yes gene_type:complete